MGNARRSGSFCQSFPADVCTDHYRIYLSPHCKKDIEDYFDPGQQTFQIHVLSSPAQQQVSPLFSTMRTVDPGECTHSDPVSGFPGHDQTHECNYRCLHGIYCDLDSDDTDQGQW